MTRSGLVKIAVLCIVLFGLPSLFPGPLGGAAKAALVASPSAVTSTTAQGTNAQAPEATSTGPSPGAPLARTEAPSVSPRVADARTPATDYGQSSGDPIYYFTTTDASGKLYDMKTTGVAGATTIQDLVPSVDGTPQSGTTTTASLSIGSFATTSYPDVVILWI